MKNRILVAALAALALFSGTALAGGYLRTDRLAWRFPANVTTAPFTQATKALAAGGTDTTIWIGTTGWYMPDINSTDSVIVARFLVHIDSTAVYAPAQTTFTASVDGAASPQAGGAPNVNTSSLAYTLQPTTGDKIIAIPVFIAGVNQVGTGIGGWSSIPPFIRLRVSSSAAMNAAGVSVQFVTPNQ